MKNNQAYLEKLKEKNPLMFHFEKNKDEFFKKHLEDEQEQLKEIQSSEK